MAYRVRTRGGFTATLTDLDGDLLNTPVCPTNNVYSVDITNPANSFTVECDNADHNAGANGEPDGYSPGLNSQ
jgi:hypothetical protein